MVPPIVVTRYIKLKAFTLNNDYFNLYFKQIQFYSASCGLIHPDHVQTFDHFNSIIAFMERLDPQASN